MTNKYVKFLCEHVSDFIEIAADKIQELETSMVGSTGTEKKTALDTYLIAKATTLIENWDIPQIPDSIEDKFIDPAFIAFVSKYIPVLSQGVYNIALKGLTKLSNVAGTVAEKIEEAAE